MEFRTFRVAPASDGSDLSPVLSENVRLSPPEARVLGCLMEKEAATPDYYPLTLNALLAACNQKSSRDPIVEYDTDEVVEALESLQSQRLTRRITSSDGGRVARYRHVADTALHLNREQAAALCILLLRGPQTVGEIRQRSQRLYDFESLDEVERSVDELCEKKPRPLAVKLARRPGSKDSRYVQLLTDDPDEEAGQADSRAVSSSPSRVERLETEIIELREQVDALRAEFERFREQF